MRFLYVLFSELLPLLAHFFFLSDGSYYSLKLILKESYLHFLSVTKFRKEMEIRVNFKILNELSVFVYSKKICIIKLFSILIMYSMSLTKKPWLKFFSELDLIFNFFFFAESKKVKKGNYIHTNIKMVFYSILLTRPYINRKKVNVSKTLIILMILFQPLVTSWPCQRSSQWCRQIKKAANLKRK